MISSVEARRAARNAGALAAASILTKGALFAWQLALARLVGEANYGVYGTVGGFVAIGTSLVNFGMGPIVIRDVARRPELAGKYLTATLFMQTLLALLAFAAVNGAAAVGGYPPEIRAFLALAALNLIVDVLGSMCNDLLLAQERMAESSLLAVVHIVLLIILAGAALLAGMGLLGVYLATLAAGVMRAGALWGLVLRGGVRPHFPFDRVVAWPLLLNGAPLALSAFLSLAYQHADKLMTLRFIGATETGYLTAAFVIVFGVVELLNTTLLIATYPMMSRVFGGEAFGFMVEKLTFFTLLICLPLALCVSIFAVEFTVPLFGAGFQPAAQALRILIWYALASMTANVLAQGLMVQNRQRLLLAVRACGLGTNIVLNALLIPRLGIAGAALASLAAELLVLAVLVRAFDAPGWRWERNPPRLARLMMVGVVSAAVMVLLATVIYSPALRLIAGVLVGLAVYTMGVLAARVLAAEDWDLLYRLAAAMPGGALVLRFWKRDTLVNW